MPEPRDRASIRDYRSELDPTQPEGGYELYRHKNTGNMGTKNWHRFYLARQNEEGDYEILSIPLSNGEYAAPGGVFLRGGFGGRYVKVTR